MTEPVEEPYRPQFEHRPRAPERREISPMLFGLGLFALSILLFAGTVGVALVYLALD